MKVFDSGMPDEAYWNSLFDIPTIVDWLNVRTTPGPIVEVGCGYGTFTVPVATETRGRFFAYDIEPAMLEQTRKNATRAGLTNIRFELRDVLEEGTGLKSESAGMVLLFNILHCDERRILLEESARVLTLGGIVAIIHWRKDIKTPRGPSIPTRPDEAAIVSAIGGLDLHLHGKSRIVKPYHWGIQLIKGINK